MTMNQVTKRMIVNREPSTDVTPELPKRSEEMRDEQNVKKSGLKKLFKNFLI